MVACSSEISKQTSKEDTCWLLLGFLHESSIRKLDIPVENFQQPTYSFFKISIWVAFCSRQRNTLSLLQQIVLDEKDMTFKPNSCCLSSRNGIFYYFTTGFIKTCQNFVFTYDDFKSTVSMN